MLFLKDKSRSIPEQRPFEKIKNFMPHHFKKGGCHHFFLKVPAKILVVEIKEDGDTKQRNKAKNRDG